MYQYHQERAAVFTEAGQVMFLQIRDRARRLLDLSGAATSAKLTAGCSGDSFLMLACVDRLVELQELILVYDKGAGQDWVYVRGALT